MNALDSKYWRALKPDAQAFDEVRFVTIPRYKDSELSGSQWRISVQMQFYRKGRLIYETFAGHNMEAAVKFAAWKYGEAIDNGNAMFAGEDDFCDQEGCAEKAVGTYQLEHVYCGEGHSSTPHQATIRMFCDKHNKRGDQSFEDSDANYKKIRVVE